MAQSPTPFHAGLTPEQVVEAAVELTRRSHLFGWSIRDLAGLLAVAPSVVYHHVGGKDLICRRVVEQVLSQTKIPQPEPDWREWFRDLLYNLGPLVAQYPGVAKWTLMHGPTVSAMLPIIEAGIATLDQCGFGERSNLAYAVLLNNAMLTVSIGDDRLQHEGDGPRDHATMMAEFHETASAASPRVQRFAEEILGPLTEGAARAEHLRDSYYRLAVDIVIAGLDALVGPEAGTVGRSAEGE
ncbi:TetR/AcrR family transcriptional regulator [Micromonospora craniellae]|uniref:TetR/AcrR family transcriptional regulator n=1 Tax=Micromonospora craniellae TaxID=2294034 RepID=A0A372FXR4_9ACTN|nr:TetR/AcrR family transcriptional regulator [Micromonospora craniellae]RFS45597.1 TetR/AcrR family transcriptional regulator [Micromonospora craniellae]